MSDPTTNDQGVSAMVDTYRAELDYLDELVSASLRR